MVNNKNRKKSIITLVISLAVIVLCNYLLSFIIARFDLTAEKRFTLSKPTIKLLKNLDDYVYVKCYLTGEMPSGFKRLQNATKETLEQFAGFGGKKFQFEFINPADFTNAGGVDEFKLQLEKKGINPVRINSQDDDNYKEQILYPWCLVSYRDKEVPVFILNNQMGKSSSEQLNNSIALLEYNITDAMNRCLQVSKKKIAITEGNGELPDASIEDFVKSLQEKYDVARVNLNNIVFLPNKIDGLIVTKPKNTFSEQEKFKIDQYIMNGGKVLWLLDMIDGDIDSLRRRNEYIAPDISLNLDDQLFNYGVRINKDLIQDMYCAPIPMVTGFINNQPQTQLFPWPYFPVITPQNNHAITKNLDVIITMFASSIDTVGAKGIKKTILLNSSKYSKLAFTPVPINLRLLKSKPNPAEYNKPNRPVAVLLEGKFTSIYKDRIAPKFMDALDSLKIKFASESVENKMIVISDGDIIKNPISKKNINYPCGYYPFTKTVFANKTFLLNCIQYLTNDDNILDSRAKENKLRMLDMPKVKEEKNKWRLINLILPLVILFCFALVNAVIRNKKYE